MDEQPKSFWWKIWGRPRRSFAWLTILSLLGCLGLGLILANIFRERERTDLRFLSITLTFFIIFILAVPGLILSVIPRTRPWMSWALRRWFFCAAIVATVIALFYAEEDWRGQRVLDRCNQEFQAKGMELNWDKFLPPPVPEDQNVFKAPKMQEWFVGRGFNELTKILESPKNFPVWGSGKTIDTEADARAYLAWSDQFQPQFNLVRDALKRPYSRMEGDYSQILILPIPNFIAIREVARTLAQRSHCHALLHEPDKAVEDLTLIHDLSHLSDARPTGKPMTLVGAMINVAVAGLYAEVIGKDFQMHVWQEAQLVELEKQLSEVHLMIPVAAAFRTEPAASARSLQTVPIKDIAAAFGMDGNLLRVVPRGWLLQNRAAETPYAFPSTEAFDAEHEDVSARACKDGMARLQNFLEHKSFYKIFTPNLLPNIFKACQVTARNQNTVNEALIACALERYRIANGSYPDSLDMLAPQFIEKIPHDIINGGPLKYRKTSNSFVLYSIGWNETDDGGTAALKKDSSPDPDNGDWVWAYSAK